VKRFKSSKEGHGCLKKLLAEAMLVKEASGGSGAKVLTTDQKREAVMLLVDTNGQSQPDACRLTDLSLSICRYDAQRPTADVHSSERTTEHAPERTRFGYRPIWLLLSREGIHVNHKAGILHYPPSWTERNTQTTERFPLLPLEVPNLTWSIYFVMDVLVRGYMIKCLSCVDDFHEGVCDDYRLILHIRWAGHRYSGLYRAVLW